mgnify:FL=1
MTLYLPYPPTVNHYYARNRNGSVRLGAAGKTYRAEVWAICHQVRLQRLAGPVAMGIEVFPPDARRRDLDNILKALLDALQYGGAYNDDNQIVHIEITRYPHQKVGAVWVRLKTLAEWQADKLLGRR